MLVSTRETYSATTANSTADPKLIAQAIQSVDRWMLEHFGDRYPTSICDPTDFCSTATEVPIYSGRNNYGPYYEVWNRTLLQLGMNIHFNADVQ